MPRRHPLAVTAFLLFAACGEKPPATPSQPSGHLFTDVTSGVGVDLPPMWEGRYRVSDSVTVPIQGMERQLSMRFVRADSTLVVDPPLAVIRVFLTEEWEKLPADSATARYGGAIAKDARHTVAFRTAPANPLAQGTADALAFDSLMVRLLARPMRASLRLAPR